MADEDINRAENELDRLWALEDSERGEWYGVNGMDKLLFMNRFHAAVRRGLRDSVRGNILIGRKSRWLTKRVGYRCL